MSTYKCSDSGGIREMHREPPVDAIEGQLEKSDKLCYGVHRKECYPLLLGLDIFHPDWLSVFQNHQSRNLAHHMVHVYLPKELSILERYLPINVDCSTVYSSSGK